jgi:hypothetical protein
MSRRVENFASLNFRIETQELLLDTLCKEQANLLEVPITIKSPKKFRLIHFFQLKPWLKDLLIQEPKEFFTNPILACFMPYLL